MMKKTLILLLGTVLLLAACSPKTTDSTADNSTDTPDSTSQESGTATGTNHDTSNLDSSVKSGDTIVIEEKVFLEQTNDMYLNPNDYLGKTIQYEGMFEFYDWGDEGEYFYQVIRYGPGCCGYDSDVGFEVIWDGGDYPEFNEWVEVVGVLEMYEEDGNNYLRLNLTSLEVKPERGIEWVF